MRSFIQQMILLGACAVRLRPHLRGGRYLIGAVVVSSLCAAVLDGVGVSLLVPLLSLLLGGEGATPMRPIRWMQTALPGHDAAYYVLAFCVLVLAAIAGKNAVNFVSQVLAARLRRRISVNLSDALFQRLQGAELHLFEARSAGEVANLFFTETSRTLGAVDLILSLGQKVTIAAFYLAILFVISWPLTLITILLAFVVGLTLAFLFRRVSRSGQQIGQLNQRYSSFLIESFAGVRVIRATNSQARLIGDFRAIQEEQAKLGERVERINALLTPIGETVAVAGAMVIVGCAYEFFVRRGLMLSSHLLGFGFILLRLLPLMNHIYGMHGRWMYLAWGIKAVEDLLDSPQHPRRPFGAVEFTGVRDTIRFEQVTFVYPNGTPALSEVTFDIPAGKTVALVGPSGSGKSTAATLLLRFRQPGAGRLTVDGRDYWEFTPASWHKTVGVVEQDAFLFHDTMAANIAFGYAAVTTEAIREAVRLAHLDDVVEALPDGLNTVVGERGTMLSGGQRQRLAIARALVRNPQILILDEATSALDTLSERQVQAALKEAMEGRTVLVIAHRLSTIRHADHIVVLEGGRIVEQGSWDQLVTIKGLFERLANLSSVNA